MNAQMKRGYFSLEGVNGKFEGVHNASSNWNGWACPFFEWSEVKAIAAALKESNPADAEQLVYTTPGKPVLCMVDGEEYDRFLPGSDGLYSIGGFSWCWFVEDDAGKGVME